MSSIRYQVLKRAREILGRLHLMLVFERHILPLSRERSEPAASQTTSWRTARDQGEASSLFEMSWNRPEAMASSSERAKRLIDAWQVLDEDQKARLHPALTRLMSLSHAFRDRAQSDDEVSETIYVMY